MSAPVSTRNFVPGLQLADTLPVLLIVGRVALHLGWRAVDPPEPGTVVVRLYSGVPVFVSDQAGEGFHAERFAIVRHVSGLKLPEGQRMILEMPRTLRTLDGRDGRPHRLCSAAAYLVGLPVDLGAAAARHGASSHATWPARRAAGSA